MKSLLFLSLLLFFCQLSWAQNSWEWAFEYEGQNISFILNEDEKTFTLAKEFYPVETFNYFYDEKQIFKSLGRLVTLTIYLRKTPYNCPEGSDGTLEISKGPYRGRHCLFPK